MAIDGFMIRTTFLAALTASLCFIGCGAANHNVADGPSVIGNGTTTAQQATRSNHDRFQGTWAIDVDRMIELDPKAAEMLKENPSMREMMEKMMGKATFTITPTDLVANLGQKEQKATYTVREDQDNVLVIESVDSGREDVEVITATFESDDSLILGKEGETDRIPLVRR
jgi:hypothetical protein